MPSRILTFILGSICLAASAFSAEAAEEPPFAFDHEESESARFVAFKWHPKDYGWLLTFRLSTVSKFAIPPISHLKFQAFNDAEEVVWEDSKVVRRKDLNGVAEGGQSLFVRVLLKDVPEETTDLVMVFDDGSEEEE